MNEKRKLSRVVMKDSLLPSLSCWLVLLLLAGGVARVDRRAFVDVVLRTSQPVKSVKEYTEPRDLKREKENDRTKLSVRIHPGDVQVVGLLAQ